jgi:hypothetical protein
VTKTGRTLAVAAALAAQLALCVDAARRSSATFDEPAHLVAGYSYWAEGDFRLNPEHPPLAKLVAAAPLLALRPRFDTDDEVWRLRRQWEMARRFLYRWNDADRLLFRARLASALWGLALTVLVFAWARRLFGDGPALLSLVLCATLPDLIAHGGLVTTDVPLAAAFLATVMAAHAAARDPRPGRGLVLGLALGVALAVKFSALLLLPILAALLVVVAAMRPESRRALVKVALTAALAAWIVVWASYGFRARLTPDPAVRADVDWSEVQPASRVVPALLNAARATWILPEAWTYGCLRFLRHAEGRPSFLNGELSGEGFRSFFAWSFVLKTPLPLLVLLVMSTLAARRAPLDRLDAWFLWLPVGVYAAVSVGAALNIGHRHLLPAYPFLLVAAGRVAQGVAFRSPRGLAAAGLAAASVASTLAVHPHELAYFNEAAGGPARGYRHLVDSSLDWGQDLGRLGDWCRANGVTHLKLAYFGTADPAHHGVPAELLPGQMLPRPATWVREVRPGDVVAVSATLLQGLYVEPEDRELFARLRAETPVARVGASIFVYRATFDWPGR